MTKKRTDGGHEIPEEDLREMEQEEGREMPDGVESQTGYCRFCGQAGMVHTLTGWSQEDVDEAVNLVGIASVTPPRNTQRVKSGSKRQRAV